MKTTVEPFEKYREEYWKANKKRKGEILNVMAELTAMHKKSIIRKFKKLQFADQASKKSMPVKQGRPCVYNFEIIFALKQLWELSLKLCGELLHPMIGEYLEQYKQNGDWKYSEEIDSKLLMMSVSTIKRKVSQSFKEDKNSFRKGKSTTKSSSIKTIIPIRDASWFDAKIGEGQLDTVVHCGDSLCRDMAYTLNYTDFKTYWIGLRAQMNKGQIATQKSLFYIQERLPFDLLEIHPDTGSEFINYHLKNCCNEIGVKMTRSRPNHKNDNMCVEERNGHIIRKKVGYIRIDYQEAVNVLNEYYENLCLFQNHFIAVRRTKDKVRIGSRYQRTFESAKTPYQRVVESNEISDDQKKKLE
ncbi:hypothetical protein K0B03_00080 [Patescibacteria group bacterium]|nr:hypothetical protein [Patescibacteria group bacterium]